MSQCHFTQYKFHVDWHGIEPGPQWQQAATNCLSELWHDMELVRYRHVRKGGRSGWSLIREVLSIIGHTGLPLPPTGR